MLDIRYRRAIAVDEIKISKEQLFVDARDIDSKERGVSDKIILIHKKHLDAEMILKEALKY
ncbi:MAG: hypothetical protein QXS25_03005 [Candidatus Nitrosocaldus sp.]